MEKNNSKKTELDTSEEDISKINEENLSEDVLETLNEDISNADEDKIEDEMNNDNNETMESSEIDQVINEEDKEKEERHIPFFKNILANICDQFIILAFSAISMLLFDFIIRIIGYMVALPAQVLLTIYFIVNCIYGPIMKKTKLRKTIAKKILNI